MVQSANILFEQPNTLPPLLICSGMVFYSLLDPGSTAFKIEMRRENVESAQALDFIKIKVSLNQPQILIWYYLEAYTNRQCDEFEGLGFYWIYWKYSIYLHKKCCCYECHKKLAWLHLSIQYNFWLVVSWVCIADMKCLFVLMSY